MVILFQFEYKRESSDVGRSKLISEFLTSWINHPSILFSVTYMMVGSLREQLLVSILSLSNLKMNDCPYCVGLGVLTKYLLLNFIFTGIPELAILYLIANLVFNCFDTKKYLSKSIFSLHFSKVGFQMIAFTATSLPRPKESSMSFFGIVITVYVFNQ